jgi:hypothetical protein
VYVVGERAIASFHRETATAAIANAKEMSRVAAVGVKDPLGELWNSDEFDELASRWSDANKLAEVLWPVGAPGAESAPREVARVALFLTNINEVPAFRRQTGGERSRR